MTLVVNVRKQALDIHHSDRHQSEEWLAYFEQHMAHLVIG